MRKALFFDIDGTLVNYQGQMPDSAKRALLRVQENGHLIVLSSGRSVCQIYPWLKDMKFDGIIGAAGAYVEYRNQAIYEHYMDEKMIVLIRSLLEEAHAVYSAQTESRVIMTKDSKRRMENRFLSMNIDRAVAEQVHRELEIDEQIERHADIEKFNFFDSQIPLLEVRNRLAEYCDVTALSFNIATERDGEIVCKGINKALGMQKFIEHAGIAREDTIAFGDGANDFDMLAYAGVGVAMGNAIPELKEQADYVTKEIDDDGIAYALSEFGLL